MDINVNELRELRKALDTSSTNGNDVLDPVILSRIISEQARKKPYIRNVIPRIPWKTNIYTWDTEVTPGDAQTATDGATLSLTDGVYQQNQAKMSYFYQLGYITNPAICAAEELVDLVALRVGGSTKAVLRKENSVIFNGDTNNSQNPGLLASLQASATYGFVGDGATLSRSLMTQLENALYFSGYEIDVWVVTQGIYSVLKEAAFNQVRFFGIAGAGAIGFPIAGPEALLFNGKPVIGDPFAGPIATSTTETLSGSGKSFSFAHVPITVATNGTDQAGTSITLPVVKDGSNVIAATGYAISGQNITLD